MKEQNKKDTKASKVDEMKKILNMQIEEKKEREKKNRQDDMKYINYVKSDLNNYNSEKKNIEVSKREKTLSYKQELDLQLKEKKLYNENHNSMADIEKQMNRDMLGEIASK